MISNKRELDIMFGSEKVTVIFRVQSSDYHDELRIAQMLSTKHGNPFYDNEGKEKSPDLVDKDEVLNYVSRIRKAHLDIGMKVIESLPEEWEGIDTTKGDWKEKWASDYSEYCIALGRFYQGFALNGTQSISKTDVDMLAEVIRKVQQENATKESQSSVTSDEVRPTTAILS